VTLSPPAALAASPADGTAQPPAAIIGLAGGLASGNLIFRDHNTVTEWGDIYENEADEASLHYMLDQFL